MSDCQMLGDESQVAADVLDSIIDLMDCSGSLAAPPDKAVSSDEEDFDVQISTVYGNVDNSGRVPPAPHRSPYSLVIRPSAGASAKRSPLHVQQTEQPAAEFSEACQHAEQNEPVKAQAAAVDVEGQGLINGISTYEYDLNQISEEDKPWRQPGADITDYFNYGFNEETWTLYCIKQRRLRAETMQINAAFQKTPLVNATGLISQVFKAGKLPVSLMTGGIRRQAVGPTNIDVIGGTDETSRRQGNPAAVSARPEAQLDNAQFAPTQANLEALQFQTFQPNSPAIAPAAFIPSSSGALQLQQQFAAALAAVRFPPSGHMAVLNRGVSRFHTPPQFGMQPRFRSPAPRPPQPAWDEFRGSPHHARRVDTPAQSPPRDSPGTRRQAGRRQGSSGMASGDRHRSPSPPHSGRNTYYRKFTRRRSPGQNDGRQDRAYDSPPEERRVRRHYAGHSRGSYRSPPPQERRHYSRRRDGSDDSRHRRSRSRRRQGRRSPRDRSVTKSQSPPSPRGGRTHHRPISPRGPSPPKATTPSHGDRERSRKRRERSKSKQTEDN